MSRGVVVGADGTLGRLLRSALGYEGVDLRCPDEDALPDASALASSGLVVNAAGPRARPELDWRDYFREHVGVTRAIVRGMRPGAHLIHLSSTAIYGARHRQLEAGALESPLTFPNAGYAVAKHGAELAALAEGRSRGVRVSVLRLSMVYGPGIDSALETLRRLKARGIAFRLGRPEIHHHYLHRDVLVASIRAVAERGPILDAPATLADPFSFTNADLDAVWGSRLPWAVPMPLGLAELAMAGWRRVLSGEPPGTLAALAVLAMDNRYAWQPAFEALGLAAAEFNRARTLTPYLEGRE